MPRFKILALLFWLLSAFIPCFGQKLVSTEWSVKSYKRDQIGLIPRVYKTPDSCLLVTGKYAVRHNPGLQLRHPALLSDSMAVADVVQKYDLNGTLLWEKVYPEPDHTIRDYALTNERHMYYMPEPTCEEEPEQKSKREKAEKILRNALYPKIFPDPDGNYVLTESNYLTYQLADTLKTKSADGATLLFYTQPHDLPGSFWLTDKSAYEKQWPDGRKFYYEFVEFESNYKPFTIRISPTADEGCIAAYNKILGLDPDYKPVAPTVTRVNAAGKAVWELRLVKEIDNRIVSMQCTPGNSCYVSGYHTTNTDYSFCGWIYKLSPSGHISWAFEAGLANLVHVTNNGSVVIRMGENTELGSKPLQYQMHAGNGELLWCFPFDDKKETVTFLQATDDGTADFFIGYKPDSVISPVVTEFEKVAIIRVTKEGEQKEIFSRNTGTQIIYIPTATTDRGFILITGTPSTNPLELPEYYTLQKTVVTTEKEKTNKSRKRKKRKQ